MSIGTPSTSRTFTAALIYAALLLDNVLLTVIVPILPDYLAELHAGAADRTAHTFGSLVPQQFLDATVDLHYVPLAARGNASAAGAGGAGAQVATRLTDENGAIGVLLATKALVQLVVTPFVGRFAQRLGYRVPIVLGTGCLLVATVVFAIGSTYLVLLLARALQGIASACIGVCGMSLIAQLYPEQERRSRVMGIILGSVALGVLVGYPFGGIVYDWAGDKAIPFWVLAALVAGCLVLQIATLDLCGATKVFTLEHPANSTPSDCGRCLQLLANRTVRLVIAAIWLSTSAMAILEPCLPIWLMENLHPKRWQIGTVFVPDSVGYFVGTNFAGAWALRVGQLRVAVGCLLMVGLSCLVIPNTTSVLSLLLPHFTLGLGIGALDAALVPLLATLVDNDFSRRAPEEDDSATDTGEGGSANYGLVYAVQQMAVSLAYAMAPLLGGEIAQYLSFRALMATVGAVNICYAGWLLGYLVRERRREESRVLSQDYCRFYESMEMGEQ